MRARCFLLFPQLHPLLPPPHFLSHPPYLSPLSLSARPLQHPPQEPTTPPQSPKRTCERPRLGWPRGPLHVRCPSATGPHWRFPARAREYRKTRAAASPLPAASGKKKGATVDRQARSHPSYLNHARRLTSYFCVSPQAAPAATSERRPLWRTSCAICSFPTPT